MNNSAIQEIWLCNIRYVEGSGWLGREMTMDDIGCHRDGPIHALKSNIEALIKEQVVCQMDLFPEWYEGMVPMEYLA